MNIPRHERDQTLFFEFSEVSQGEIVNWAELRLYKEKSSKWTKADFDIEVRLIEPSNDPE